MEPSIVLGDRDNEVTPRVQELVTALTRAGIRTVIAPDIDAAIWEKFMLIVTWSGIGSVTRAPIGVWRALPGLRSMAESSVREVVEVARARTVSLDDDHATATLRALDGVPPDSMVSMQRDILNGRPSELEAQSGAVVRLGGATGVATPTHAFIYHSLAPQQNAARSLSSRATRALVSPSASDAAHTVNAPYPPNPVPSSNAARLRAVRRGPLGWRACTGRARGNRTRCTR